MTPCENFVLFLCTSEDLDSVCFGLDVNGESTRSRRGGVNIPSVPPPIGS